MIFISGKLRSVELVCVLRKVFKEKVLRIILNVSGIYRTNLKRKQDIKEKEFIRQ